MPRFAKILCVQMQNDTPCIWAMVDPKQETEMRHFEIFGTGHSIPIVPETMPEIPARVYVGTYQEAGGALVWHLFERNLSVFESMDREEDEG
jgi:hypothetical protein